MRFGFVAAFVFGVCLAGGAGHARADDLAGARYVNANSLNVRLCPKADCPVAVKLERGAPVTHYETQDGWARISAWYAAADERENFPDIEGEQVARWVSARYLSDKKPPPAPLVTGSVRDRRILHMPRPGEGGLSAKEVQMLRKYAKRLLDSGACTSITNADKSRTRPGTYFVTCGNEYQSRYFKAGSVR